MRWPREVAEFVAENYADRTNRELSDMVREELGVEMSVRQLNNFARNHHLLKSPETFARRTRNARYSGEWREWFRGFVPGHSEREISDECERVWGFPMSEGMVGNWKHELGVKSGTCGGRFEKGHASRNKGKKWDDFLSKEAQERIRASGNMFADGNVPANRREIGESRVCKDGYVWVKVRDGARNGNWQPLHRVVWEREHGPVPDGHMVVFLDGDSRNFDPANLALESKKEHGVISVRKIGYWDEDSHEVAKLMARIMSKRRELERRA